MLQQSLHVVGFQQKKVHLFINIPTCRQHPVNRLANKLSTFVAAVR
jgi:hypothetical protein